MGSGLVSLPVACAGVARPRLAATPKKGLGSPGTSDHDARRDRLAVLVRERLALLVRELALLELEGDGLERRRLLLLVALELDEIAVLGLVEDQHRVGRAAEGPAAALVP